MKQKQRKHVFHLQRFGLFSVLIAAFFIVRLDAGASARPLVQSNHVLAYATEMSRSALLSSTNSARASNGLGSLALNSQLNSSAQAKADDMVVKDYWAHVAPDGTQPWYFFEQAGYEYIRAGENLAYGFMTSQGAIDGWMNSPSHRANMLGDYQDVGFGIANAPNYQASGNQTIVVAHYGTRASAPAPAPAPAAPVAPAPSSSPSPAPTTAPAPVASAVPADQPKTETPSSQNAADEPNPQAPATEQMVFTAAPAPVQTAGVARTSVLSMVASHNAPIAALASLVMVCFATLGYALTHRSAFQHAVASGEHFVVAHPGLDTGIVAAVTSLILLTTYGHIG